MKKRVIRKITIAGIAIMILCMLTACLGEDLLAEETSQPNQGNSLEAGESFVAQGEPGTWLVMLYQDADDEILERDVFLDLNEAEIVGSSDQVTIISQLDRYDGEFDGDGDWTTTKRFLIGQDYDLETIESEELDDIGEADMSDPQTLVDFAVWAIKEYPAEHYVLVLSDHGMGWLGGWTDPDPYEGSDMSLQEIDSALAAIVNSTGIGQFDLVGFDACLMAQLETMNAMAPYAKYVVASEETEPSVGWAYASFLETLVENPDFSASGLASSVVDSYISEDYRITDDDARVSFIDENYTYGSDMSAAEVAADMSVDITMSAIDLSKISDLNAAFNDLIVTLSETDQSGVAAARSYAQSYTSVFDKGIPDSFLDLGNFVEMVMDETGDSDVTSAGQAVLDAIEQAVIAEKHGELKPGSTGISFYFPNSELYEMTTDESFAGYTSIANRHAAASLWDDFLANYYTNKSINAELADLSVLEPVSGAAVADFTEAIAASAPEEDAVVESPGLGDISIDALYPSTDELEAGDTMTLTADISGSNIAYIYYYVNYFFEEDDSYLMADMGYLNSDSMNEVGGSIYPDWGSGEDFTIETEWTPTVYYLSDGVDEAFVYLEPEVYGETYEDDIYTLYGLYAPDGDTDKEQEAMIRFDGNFATRSFWVFTGQEGTGAPREATLKEGDTFSPWLLWQEYNEDTDEWDYVYYLGDTLTYYGQPFEIFAYDAFPGLYELGIMVEDFDGNTTEDFVNVTIPEY